MDIVPKKISIKLLLISFLIFSSCKNETCKGIEFNGGRSFKDGSAYSGTCITHHTNGEIKSIQNYKNGYDHGKWEFFYADKTYQVQGSFLMGKKDGLWFYYYQNGAVSKEHFYENGKKSGVWKSFDENGKLISATQIN